MVRTIRRADKDAEIVVVVGYKAAEVKKELEGENVIFVMNPFYEVTNSISSLWFAREYLERENVAIVHGDVVFEDDIITNILTVPTDHPYKVPTDSSYRSPRGLQCCFQGRQSPCHEQEAGGFYSQVLQALLSWILYHPDFSRKRSTV